MMTAAALLALDIALTLALASWMSINTLLEPPPDDAADQDGGER